MQNERMIAFFVIFLIIALVGCLVYFTSASHQATAPASAVPASAVPKSGKSEKSEQDKLDAKRLRAQKIKDLEDGLSAQQIADRNAAESAATAQAAQAVEAAKDSQLAMSADYLAKRVVDEKALATDLGENFTPFSGGEYATF